MRGKEVEGGMQTNTETEGGRETERERIVTWRTREIEIERETIWREDKRKDRGR